MLRFIIKRLVYMLFVVWVVSLIAFLLLRLAPSDTAEMMLPDTATEEQVQAMRVKLGLDQPLTIQYWNYMKDLLRGDLGVSNLYGYSCSKVIFARLPATATVALLAAIIILFISIPMGIIAGANKGKPADIITTFIVVLGQSMAIVWVCVLLLLVFSVKLQWLPSMGYYGLSKPEYLVMPVIASGYRLNAEMTRMGRSGMIDVLSEDYITATYARGINPFKVYTKYALKNALIPVITIYGLNISSMLAGAVVIESVFSIPGIGSMLVNAVNHRDYPLVQSTLVVMAIMFAIINLIVDVVNAFIDRRMELN